MGIYYDFLSALGPMLEVCLVWRLLRKEMRWRYPYLLAYVVFCLFGTELVLLVTRRILTEYSYQVIYWRLEIVGLLFRFAVVWEILRHTPLRFQMSSRRTSPRPGLAAGWAGGIAITALIWWRAYLSFHSHLLALECSLGLAQTVLVLVPLLLIRWRGLSISRNLWGLALGFGAYISTDILHFALFDISQSSTYFRAAVPTTFGLMLAFWTWALWNYAPDPNPVPAREEAGAEDLDWWTVRWEQARTAARKVANP